MATDDTTTKKVTALKPGDRFVCNGQVCKVLAARKGAAGRRFVRTDHHDHNFRTDRTVEVAS